MKKLCAVILIISVLLSVCACGKSSEEIPSVSEEASAEAETVTEDIEHAPEKANTESPKSEPEKSEEFDPTEKAKESKEAAEEKPSEPQSESEPMTAEIAETDEEPSQESEPEISVEEPEPYSQPMSDTVLKVTGSALPHDFYFSMSDIYSFGGVVSDDYFSRGKEPQEMTTHFTGISVEYLLSSIIGITDYKKAVFSASDGYSGSYSRYAIGASYINEKDPDSSLSMILAWEEDGSPCALRLVMGQQVEGEYNRTYWIRDVISIEVKAS